MKLTDEQINFIKEHLKVAGEQTLPLLLDTIEALRQEKLQYIRETSDQLGKEIVRVGELQQEISWLKTAINAQGKEIIKRGTDNVKLQRENEQLQAELAKIQELAKVQAEGRLVVLLPVNTEVYIVRDGEILTFSVYEFSLHSVNNQNVRYWAECVSDENEDCLGFWTDEIEKAIFLTRAAAEKAIAEVRE